MASFWAFRPSDLIRSRSESGSFAIGYLRRGFSFVEIMFAVIILGIGFIMIAALFPVAIQQTQATSNDVAATAMAQNAAQSLPYLVSGQDMYSTGDSGATPAVPPIYVSFGVVQAYGTGGFGGPSTYGVNPFPASPTASASAGATGWPIAVKTAGSLISSGDPRYGWVGFYSRDATGPLATATPAPSANVIAIITQCQNAQAVGYNSAIDLNPSAGTPATLQGFPISVRIIDAGTATTVINGLATTDLIMIAASQGANGTPDNFTYYDAAATGAFVVISQDKCGGTLAGHFNGRIFRLGARRADLDPNDKSYQVWELQPGNDFTPDPATSPNYAPTIPYQQPGGGGPSVTGAMPNGVNGGWSNAFIVGRALLDPTSPYTVNPYAIIKAPAAGEPPRQYIGQPNVFVGNNQAIAAYSFTIQVH